MSGLRIQPGKSVAVRTYPQVSVRVLADAHNGGGYRVPDARTLLKMRLLLSVRGYAVDAVIVCPYPIGAGMVFTYGHDTAGTDCVVGGRFISHVLEVVDNGWHYHNSFLEESQPYVPLLVFEDGVYLGLVKVETGNVDRAFHYLSLLDVIHFHSVSVGSDVDFILVHVIEGLDGQFRMRRTLNAGEAVCLRIVFEQSVFQASHVDISCFVFADGRRPHHFSPIRIVRHPLVGVYAVYSFVIGDYPQCSVTVFVELVDEIAWDKPGQLPGCHASFFDIQQEYSMSGCTY